MLYVTPKGEHYHNNYKSELCKKNDEFLDIKAGKFL